MTDEEIGTIRIDVPLLSNDSHLYVFVSDLALTWDPWWSRLRRYLLGLGLRVPFEARTEEGSPELIELVKLERADREDLVEVLTSAPEEVKREHRGLARALKVLPQTSFPVIVRFFPKDAPRY